VALLEQGVAQDILHNALQVFNSMSLLPDLEVYGADHFITTDNLNANDLSDIDNDSDMDYDDV